MIKMINIKKPYGVLKGMLYAVIIYALLWWIPVFGPMISGYVAGRKSGSPVKGLFAVLIPASILIIFIYILSTYHLVYTLHAEYLKNVFLFIYVPLNALSNYISNFNSFLHYIPPSLLILAIFAYIGGIMSLHVQNEGVNSENKKIKEWQKHPEPIDNNLVEETVEKPKIHPLIKKAVKQKHNEFKKRKKEEELDFETL
jgi:hypothetical protein